MQKTTEADKKKPKKKLSFRTPESEVFRVRRLSTITEPQYFCSAILPIESAEDHHTHGQYFSDNDDDFELEVFSSLLSLC